MSFKLAVKLRCSPKLNTDQPMPNVPVTLSAYFSLKYRMSRYRIKTLRGDSKRLYATPHIVPNLTDK